ncbi:MAG: BamA/TamA family outer membrane protein [Candidatus Omnitrophica bacterium]|nr:BamA/TamA family outer membrane protein [Candidatus Omnitrophota bacterium]
MKKVFIFLVIFAIGANFSLFAEGGNPDLGQIMEKMEALQQRVGQLENKVKQQDETIRRQRRALEKIGESVPIVKEMLAPPEPKVMVKKFILEGVNLFDAKDFEKVLDKYRNKKLGMSDFKKIAKELTNLYRSKGYLTSLVYAPEQEMKNNTLKFSVVEGRIGDIRTEDGKYYSKADIDEKITVEKGQILDYTKLQKNIKRINQQPDRTVKAVLAPGKEKGTSDILIKFKEEVDPIHWYLTYNNRGTKSTGRNRFGLQFVNNNLLGNEDILSARVQTGENYDEVYAGSMDYNFPVWDQGTRVGFYAAHSHADIGGQFAVLTPEGEATAWGVYLKQPWFDKDFMDPVAFNLSSNLIFGFDSISAWNKILGQETSHDEVRVVKAGISFDEKDSIGRTVFSNELRVGIPDFLGSMDQHEESASRLDAGGQFVKYTGSLSRVNRIGAASLLIGRVSFQATDEPLVNSEQFSLGGADSIRGFPENDYLADYGWAGSFEIRTPAFLFPPRLKIPDGKDGKVSLRDALQFVYFVDFGKGYEKKPRVGEKESRFLIGAGFGLRFDLMEKLSGRIDFGFPVGNEEPSDGSSSRVHIGLRYEF